MIHSMTGYGKAEALLSGGKLTVEIRTLNGKTADINLKSQILPKDKELEIRSRIAAVLVRGTIDVYLTWEADASASARQINAEIAHSYLRGADELAERMGLKADDSLRGALLCSVLRMPDVAEVRKGEIFSEEDLVLIEDAFKRCLDMVEEYREKEGQVLYRDVTSRVAKILSLYDGVESFESERTANMRAKILKAAEDLGVKLDKERFEQEMIFYIEKFDINEEKVRLRQHCKYFMDTIDSEPYPGKKLGFIIQEMGREINTTGSKANHSEIQKLVVQMKDELEKIREQSMNIL
ncbi:MAG: YicC/YloC family endoribonuclease [Candidatus Cryptobacteroides sp.]|nr:YicC family protein [Bacteroidales bacterium]MDY6157876.1 YicC/YloC family endoribonuclease [Candidatus Cryptobacteroides sp.]